MELLQTLFPSASHCIKWFCNFIRILCLCRCQSAVKLKLQTEILHFHPQWKLRKSIFSTGRGMAWLCDWVILSLWEGSCDSFLESRKEGGSLRRFAQESSLVHNVVLSSSECNSVFLLFLWMNWGGAGEVFIPERSRPFSKVWTLKLKVFLWAGSIGGRNELLVASGLLKLELGTKRRSRLKVQSFLPETFLSSSLSTPLGTSCSFSCLSLFCLYVTFFSVLLFNLIHVLKNGS